MKLITFLVCDDIRMEEGNKISFMGVYFDSIIFSSKSDRKENWPKSLRLSLYARIQLGDQIPHYFKFRFKLNKKETVVCEGELSKPPNTDVNTFNLIITQSILEFISYGKASFFLDFFNEDKIKIKTLKPKFELRIQ